MKAHHAILCMVAGVVPVWFALSSRVADEAGNFDQTAPSLVSGAWASETPASPTPTVDGADPSGAPAATVDVNDPLNPNTPADNKIAAAPTAARLGRDAATAQTDSSRRSILEYLRLQAMTPQQRQASIERDRIHEAEQWTTLLSFVRENSPNRYVLLAHLNPMPGAPIRNRLMQRWLTLQQQQANQPDLYAVHVREFQEEDVVMGLVAEVNHARSHNMPRREQALRQRIAEEASKLVELNLQERAVRIKTLEDVVSQEQKRLAADTANKAAMVNDRAEQILQRVDRTLRVDSPSGDGG